MHKTIDWLWKGGCFISIKSRVFINSLHSLQLHKLCRFFVLVVSFRRPNTETFIIYSSKFVRFVSLSSITFSPRKEKNQLFVVICLFIHKFGNYECEKHSDLIPIQTDGPTSNCNWSNKKQHENRPWTIGVSPVRFSLHTICRIKNICGSQNCITQMTTNLCVHFVTISINRCSPVAVFHYFLSFC